MAAAFKCMCSFNRHTGRQSSRDYGKARAIFAEHRTGKTKETCPILAASAKKRTGQNSATNPRIAACAKRAKGKTKETCPTLAAMSKTKAGRTKLTHASVASQAKKLTGRTKHNHSGVAAFTQKKSKHIYVIDGVEYLGGRDASNDSGLCRESIARICIRVELDQIIQASAIKGATVKGSILYGRYDLIGQSYSVLGISRKLNPSYTGNKT